MSGRSPGSSPAPDGSRIRRSTTAVRADLLHAAREVFGERGYAGARTREIADRAHATEQTMYRHFRTKEELFQQAVFEPFGQLVDSFIKEFEARAELNLSEDQLAHDYVTMLFGFLRENRREVLALISLRSHHPELFSQGPLDDLFPAMEQAVVTSLRDQGRDQRDAGLAVRLTFGMVLSAAVFDDQLLGLDADGDQDRLLAVLSSYVAAGVGRNSR
ncbi:helix-turn-helix domain-containing protein [Streptomyces sp. NPDC005349]|uniref:TetR/AcrR family transcriptional regulator n=1 Tax=Streptomyces sp. NPDC005349 TaxID=3157037 RepID=UPI0033A4D729